jgi:hypothetical protein
MFTEKTLELYGKCVNDSEFALKFIRAILVTEGTCLSEYIGEVFAMVEGRAVSYAIVRNILEYREGNEKVSAIKCLRLATKRGLDTDPDHLMTLKASKDFVEKVWERGLV